MPAIHNQQVGGASLHHYITMLYTGLLVAEPAKPLVAYDEALRNNTTKAYQYQMLYSLVQGLTGKGDLKHAEEVGKKLVGLFPGDVDALTLLGQVYSQAGEWENAVVVYKKAVECEAKHLGCNFNLAVVLGKMGRREEAIEQCRATLLLDVKNMTTWQHLSHLLFTSSNYAEALPTLLHLTSHHPPSITPQTAAMIATCRAQLAESSIPPATPWDTDMTSRNFAEVEKSTKLRISTHPKDVDAKAALGQALMNLNRVSEAEQCFKEALKINQKHVNATYGLGCAYLSQQKTVAARVCLEKAVKADPYHSAALHTLGNCLLETNPWEAVKMLNRAIAVDPHLTNGYFNLACGYGKLGDFEKSIEMLKKVIDLDPQHDEAHASLGIVCLDLSRHQEAVEYLKTAVSLNTKYSNLLEKAEEVVATAGPDEGKLPNEGKKDPTWAHHASECMQCHARFTFTNRRHHCRNCGKLVCGPCSPGRAEVDGYKGMVRICTDCKQ